MAMSATVPAPVTGGRPRRWAVLTGCYLLVLLLTTLAAHLVSTPTADALLDASSTDVWHLVHRPLRVLVASALWLPDEGWEATAVVLGVAMAALEARVGARRTLLVFASGHVLATLLTEVPVGVATLLGLLPSSAAHRLDVGVSYGTFAVVGALAGLLPVRVRVAVLAVAGLLVVVPLAGVHDLTSAGHALSLLIGLAWWPALRSAAATPSAQPGAAGDVSWTRLPQVSSSTATTTGPASVGGTVKRTPSRVRRACSALTSSTSKEAYGMPSATSAALNGPAAGCWSGSSSSWTPSGASGDTTVSQRYSPSVTSSLSRKPSTSV
jgi:hypothetical protein